MSQGPNRIAITGANGFVGRHLVDAIRTRLPNATVIRIDRSASSDKDDHDVRILDILEEDAVARVIADTNPDALVHLAAASSVSAAYSNPRAAWRTNVMGTLEVVTALQRHAPDCHLLHVSSAEVYGRSVGSGEPVTEEAALRPMSPYGASKAASEIVVGEAVDRGLFATIVRPFNHTGPGQDERFVIPAFCSQVASIEQGRGAPQLLVGELGDERDFMDVSDIVGLYLGVIEAGRRLPQRLVMNAASGVPRRVGDILETILSASTVREIEVKIDPGRLRPGRIPRIVGDPSLARSLLGWEATKPFKQTLDETLAYWRGRSQ